MDIITQHDQMDCGPACLAMVASHYHKRYSLQYLRDNSFITREGVSMLGIIEAASKIGFETLPAKLTFNKLIDSEGAFPCIVHWEHKHFVVLIKTSKSLFSKKRYLHIADPGHGRIRLSEEQFNKSWLSDNNMGVALFLEPGEAFFQKEPPPQKRISLAYLLSFLKPYKRQFSLIFLMLFLGSCITLLFPFLTQNLIDKGVNAGNLNLIGVILLAQLGLYLGAISIEIFRNWLTLLVGTRISITVISDYLRKVLQLPMRFYDSKKAGDFNQRIQDNERVEEFLTSQSLTTLFSIINFSVFFGVLWYYNVTILAIYLVLTVLSVIWSYYWLKKRRLLDYLRFQQRSDNQEAVFEIVKGVSEMKLNQFEEYKRKEWETIQGKLFKLNIRILKLNQYQVSGFEFLNQIKNILVTFLAATFVVQGKMSLGALLSVSYIVGQMNSPVNQLVAFFRSLQEARLSLERLHEVQSLAPEENSEQVPLEDTRVGANGTPQGIRFSNVSFQYEGARSPYALKDINLFIPEGKITAIVGASGSGKTTLMKLLLSFYPPTHGEICYNGQNTKTLSPKSIRQKCGVVMQDGYIFSDTIARNIATGDEVIDQQILDKAAGIANIKAFIESLPLKYNTKIGASGNGLSGGQKQRMLIARAVYKNPHYIFFDEATSALDAENEKIIHNHLQSFFKGRTVLIIAHRLSTVKNADQIVVLKDGQIVERGTHSELVAQRASYFNLVKNQLELGT